MRQQHGALLIAHRFLPGDQDDAPLLVPLAAHGKEARMLTAFCRHIYPGAPILAPQLAPTSGANEEKLRVQRLTQLIQKAGVLYDLTLMPMVLVGQGDEVELAVQVALRGTTHITACILLRPTRSIAALPVGSLTGLAVLLACGAESAAANRGQALRRLLAVAGADVVTIPVKRRHLAGGNDVAVCRVFLETIFTASNAGT